MIRGIVVAFGVLAICSPLNFGPCQPTIASVARPKKARGRRCCGFGYLNTDRHCLRVDYVPFPFYSSADERRNVARFGKPPAGAIDTREEVPRPGDGGGGCAPALGLDWPLRAHLPCNGSNRQRHRVSSGRLRRY